MAFVDLPFYQYSHVIKIKHATLKNSSLLNTMSRIIAFHVLLIFQWVFHLKQTQKKQFDNLCAKGTKSKIHCFLNSLSACCVVLELTKAEYFPSIFDCGFLIMKQYHCIIHYNLPENAATQPNQ